MAKLRGKDIQELAKEIIARSPGGIRYSALVERIFGQNPETPNNTIHGAVWDLDKTFSGEVFKPSRGLFTLDGKGLSSAEQSGAPIPATIPTLREADFYESFAEWLKNDLDEATEAIALGGSGLRASNRMIEPLTPTLSRKGRGSILLDALRSKWGTPDVVGTFKPLPSNRVKFDLEVISAEIKTSPTQSIEAFGQATAYRLFSHKVYLVMPVDVSVEDQSRLEALAMLFGIGFVQFDLNQENPNYRVRVRAQRFTPDMFYLNEFAERLHDHNKPAFNKLFQ